MSLYISTSKTEQPLTLLKTPVFIYSNNRMVAIVQTALYISININKIEPLKARKRV